MNDNYQEPKDARSSLMSKENYILFTEIIVIVGIIIAMIMLSVQDKDTSKVTNYTQPEVAAQVANNPSPVTTASLDQMKAVSKEDHILGSFDAPVKIVEYSDSECPFCKRFHSVMQQVMAEYGDSGKVAWVYRHYPIPQLHAKATKEAEAMECANELGGNEKFWAYTDRLYEITPSNDGLAVTELNNIAQFIGLDAKKFTTCLASGRHTARIQGNVQDAMATGGNGTPWSIVVAPNGKKYELSGAQAYASVKQLIELALQEK